MSPVLKKAQKGSPEFVASHLSATFLILEGASFNVNQAGKTLGDWRQYDSNRRHEVFSKLVETLAIPFWVGKCLVVLPNFSYIFNLAHLDIMGQFG
jgi:hypothetical protein